MNEHRSRPRPRRIPDRAIASAAALALAAQALPAEASQTPREPTGIETHETGPTVDFDVKFERLQANPDAAPFQPGERITVDVYFNYYYNPDGTVDNSRIVAWADSEIPQLSDKFVIAVSEDERAQFEPYINDQRYGSGGFASLPSPNIVEQAVVTITGEGQHYKHLAFEYPSEISELQSDVIVNPSTLENIDRRQPVVIIGVVKEVRPAPTADQSRQIELVVNTGAHDVVVQYYDNDMRLGLNTAVEDDDPIMLGDKLRIVGFVDENHQAITGDSIRLLVPATEHAKATAAERTDIAQDIDVLGKQLAQRQYAEARITYARLLAADITDAEAAARDALLVTWPAAERPLPRDIISSYRRDFLETIFNLNIESMSQGEFVAALKRFTAKPASEQNWGKHERADDAASGLIGIVEKLDLSTTEREALLWPIVDSRAQYFDTVGSSNAEDMEQNSADYTLLTAAIEQVIELPNTPENIARKVNTMRALADSLLKMVQQGGDNRYLQRALEHLSQDMREDYMAADPVTQAALPQHKESLRAIIRRAELVLTYYQEDSQIDWATFNAVGLNVQQVIDDMVAQPQ